MNALSYNHPADMSEGWQRLRWARHRWQTKAGIKPSAQAAAESLGLNPHTYRTYEGPPDRSRYSPLTHQLAIRFGRKFGVSWQWLLTGEGDPTDIELNPSQQRIVDALRDAPCETQKAVADIVERLVRAM